MSRLMWNVAGERFYEAGVDRGVLYLENTPGIVWNGLISVNEVPEGGDIVPYYVDGVKIKNHSENATFQAEVEAFIYPDEFALCDGTVEVANGLFVNQQKKLSFGLSYRSKVGSDQKSDLGYKIHMVYQAMASPTETNSITLSESVEPSVFSWTIFSKPSLFSGFAPTAHFVVDSRKTPTELLSQIEDILYGTESSMPRLPSVTELMYIFGEYQASIFDAGFLVNEYFNEFDAGIIPELQTSTIDGGSP